MFTAALCGEAKHTQAAVWSVVRGGRSLTGWQEGQAWFPRATPPGTAGSRGLASRSACCPQGTPRTPLTATAGPGTAAARSWSPRAGAPRWTAWCATGASAEGGWWSPSGSKIWVRTDDVCHHFNFPQCYTTKPNGTKLPLASSLNDGSFPSWAAVAAFPTPLTHTPPRCLGAAAASHTHSVSWLSDRDVTCSRVTPAF